MGQKLDTVPRSNIPAGLAPVLGRSSEADQALPFGRRAAAKALPTARDRHRRGALRILTLNYEFPPVGGGASPMSHELCRELVALGHEVDVVTMGFDGLPARDLVDGINLYRVPCLRRRPEICRTHEMGSFLLGALPTLSRLVRARRYHVNHTHFIMPTGVLGRLMKMRTGIPLVVTAHGSDVPGYNPDRFQLQHRILGPLWRWIVTGVDHLVSPSAFLRHLIEGQGRPPSMSIIPNGFRFERFRVDRVRERRILVVTRMIPRKGVQHLLRALESLDLRGFEVDIVGDGPYLPTLRRMAADRDLPVTFWGWLDNRSDQLRRLYERSMIFVLTSEAENFPTVLLEAMAAGLAIVTCEGTGSAEVVGDAALLVPPRRPDRLRMALERLIGDEALRSALARRSRARIEREFGWRGIAERHLELYDRLAGLATRPVPAASCAVKPSSAPAV